MITVFSLFGVELSRVISTSLNGRIPDVSRKIGVLVLLSYLSACATFSVSSFYTLKDKTTEGLAVVSLSFEGLGLQEAPVWRYRRVDGKHDGELITRWAWEPLDWVSPPGRLAYFALPPGQYEFFESGFSRITGGGGITWTIGPGGIPTNSNPYYAGFNQPASTRLSSEPFSVKFEIKAGTASYIGNLHFVWREAERKGIVTVHDESGRDLALLLERLPRVDRSVIRSALK